MTSCFADTFYFVALLNPHDQFHGRVVAFANDLRRPIVTTTSVLLELGNFFASTPSRALVQPFIQRVRAQALAQVVPSGEAIFDRGLELYNERPDKQWSLTDCISFIVMREMGLTDALTGDHHFEQAGFTALFKDQG